MNKKHECAELQSRMIDHFSESDAPLEPEVKAHLAACPGCKQEYEQMQTTLQLIHIGADEPTELPDHLLGEIEERLDSVPQLKPEFTSSHQKRNMLILQYSYLATLAIIIWFSLLLSQPLFNNWLEAYEVVNKLPILQDYSLFIAFFAAGGLFALISSPLIIKTTIDYDAKPGRGGILRRIFSGSLRLFAC